MRVSCLVFLLASSGVSGFLITPGGGQAQRSSFTSLSDSYSDATEATTGTDFNENAFLQQMGQDKEEMKDFDRTSLSPFSAEHSVYDRSATRLKDLAAASKEKHTGLNENAFVKQMDQDHKEMKYLDQLSLATTAHHEDVYDKASARLQTLAAASILSHGGAEQMEQEVAATKKKVTAAVKSKQQVSSSNGNNPAAFATIGVALAAAAVSQNPDLMDQIAHFDPSTLHFDNIHVQELVDQMTIQLSVMKDSFESQAHQLAEAVQIDAMKEAMITAWHDLQVTVATQVDLTKEFAAVQMAAVEHSVHDLQAELQMSTPMLTFKETVAAQTASLQDSVLPDLKASLQDMTDSTTAFVQTTWDRTGSTLQGAFANLPTSEEIQGAVALRTANLENAWQNLDRPDLGGLSAQMASVTASLETSMHQAQDSVQANMETIQGQLLPGAMGNMQQAVDASVGTLKESAAGMQATMDAQVGDLKEQLPGYTSSAQAQLGAMSAGLQSAVQGGVDSVQSQLPGVVNNVQQTLDAQVGGLKESASGLQSVMDAQVGDLKEQLPGYTSGAQAQLGAMSAGLQSTVQGGVDSVQSQLPGVVNNVQQTLDAQFGGLKESAAGMQSVMDAQVGDLKEQLPGVMNNIQQAVDAQVGGLKDQLPGYTSGAQAGAASVFAGMQHMMHNMQEATKGGVDSVQTQLPGVMNNVQQVMDAQVGGLKESASGLQSAMDAQVGDLTESLPGKMESLSAGVMGQVAAVHNSVQQTANEASLNMPNVDDMAAHAKGASSAMREHLDTVRMNIDKVEIPKVDIPKMENLPTLPKVDVAVPKVVIDMPKVSAPAVTTAAKSLSNFDISGSSTDIESFFH